MQPVDSFDFGSSDSKSHSPVQDDPFSYSSNLTESSVKNVPHSFGNPSPFDSTDFFEDNGADAFK